MSKSGLIALFVVAAVIGVVAASVYVSPERRVERSITFSHKCYEAGFNPKQCEFFQHGAGAGD